MWRSQCNCNFMSWKHLQFGGEKLTLRKASSMLKCNKFVILMPTVRLVSQWFNSLYSFCWSSSACLRNFQWFSMAGGGTAYFIPAVILILLKLFCLLLLHSTSLNTITSFQFLVMHAVVLRLLMMRHMLFHRHYYFSHTSLCQYGGACSYVEDRLRVRGYLITKRMVKIL